ncbi:MAG TPA: glycine cleavage system aminomethyltransferase GcvT [Candidatus Limnocylindrales bacterium]|nr:glycine cleavage system aminomethyltransferase GcvT [Candidatus Limnocylindrales bacterium]
MQRTPLYDRHVAAGGRLIDFAGWEMPVQYGGIFEEHRAVRERAGLFDLSHMGELWVEGPGALEGLAQALVNDPAGLAVGRAQYSLICVADGGILDDLIVYRVGPERFLTVPNAANRTTVADALAGRLAAHAASFDDASLRTALVAIQGPRAAAILAPLTEVDLGALRNYAIAAGEVAGVAAQVARTGYTGEDGFELFVDWSAAGRLWDALLEAGAGEGLQPCGLGARDTLRLEAGMPLYGNELSLDTDPFEAGLGRIVKLERPRPFVGRAVLEQRAAEGPPARRLVGLVLRGRGVPRHGYPVWTADGREGVVTSGTVSPTLGQAIAMAYVPSDQAAPGTMLEVGIREARVPAEVADLPFYRRPK